MVSRETLFAAHIRPKFTGVPPPSGALFVECDDCSVVRLLAVLKDERFGTKAAVKGKLSSTKKSQLRKTKFTLILQSYAWR